MSISMERGSRVPNATPGSGPSFRAISHQTSLVQFPRGTSHAKGNPTDVVCETVVGDTVGPRYRCVTLLMGTSRRECPTLEELSCLPEAPSLRAFVLFPPPVVRP